MPWVEAWLDEAGTGAQPPAPRNFIYTPFALTSLGLAPADCPPLAAPPVSSPPEAVRRLAAALYTTGRVGSLPADGLHDSVARAEVGAVERLSAGADLAARGPHGHTPLTLAALLGAPRTVDTLLAAGASPAATDALGNTPMHWAAVVGDHELVARLLAAGAEPDAENLLGGRAGDYLAAWRRRPPAQPGIPCLHRDGRRRTPPTSEAFASEMGFEYLGAVRPGVDFFFQILLKMWEPEWRQRVAQELDRCGHLPRPDFRRPPLFMKDFGPPWGWGICSERAIAAGVPVTTYVGDLIHSYEMVVDLVNHGFSTYVSNAQPSDWLQGAFLAHFDARRSGNLGSRINSAHAPGAENLGFACRFWRGLPEVVFTANRDICAGEQLSWYYGDGFWRGRGAAATPLPRF